MTYMIHFSNFLKGGTEFFIFFFNIIPMLIQFLREQNFCCNISMLGLSWVKVKVLVQFQPLNLH